MLEKTTDITLVGAGIIGLLTAREFLLRGYSVNILDKNLLGQESSWAGGGILMPLYPWRQSEAITKLLIQSLKLYPDLEQELKHFTSIDPEHINSGLMITQNPDIQLAREWCKHNNFGFEEPSLEKFDQILPRLTATLENPLWLPEACQIRNPRLLKALKAYLIKSGVSIIEHCEIQGFDVEKKNIKSIQTSRGKIGVNHLILTTGAWSSQLYQKILEPFNQPKLQIFPVKGQMLLIATEPGFLDAIILQGENYLIPRKDGKLVIGSTVEHNVLDKRVTQYANKALLRFAYEVMPELKKFPLIAQWAGLRPGTENGIPYIDTHPELANLSFNCGHYRNGFALGPASAQLMFDLVNQSTPAVSPAPFKLSAIH